MLAEFMEFLYGKAEQQAKPVVLRPDGEPNHRYLLANPYTGSVEFRSAEPAPRKHQALSLETVVDMARTVDSAAEVWYSRKSISCLLDGDTRRDRICMELDFSKQLVNLQALEQKSPSYSQKDFVKILRIGFAGCLSACPTLLSTVRGVKFRVGSEGESVIQHGKTSIGRRLESEITGEGTIPEEVVLTVPIWIQFREIVERIRCAIEVHSDEQTFQLIPFPNEIEHAIQRGEEKLQELLCSLIGYFSDDELNVPLYYGMP